RFVMDVVLAHPPEYKLMEDTMESARKFAKESGTKFEVTDNMDAAFEGADIVYPKSWGAFDLMSERLSLTSQQQIAANETECLKLNAKYKDWICDDRRMKLANKEAVYMHCLPADRGNEVTDSVIDGPQSVVFQEAENRLHTAKAIMASVMRERPFS
ncbi:MAG: ornithine carbamoyltransferase, partial [Candidatus Sumerlaeia bacterium]|nr:ornithine carbamoyltransferase [Candidatus Sumerlaeia bacterium]